MQTCVQPSKVALIFPAQQIQFTFQDLEDRSNQVAAWLLSLGLQENDGIALLLENRPELMDIALAATKIGIYYTPMSTHLASDEIAHILSDSGARILIVSEQTMSEAQALMDKHFAAGQSQQIRRFTVDDAREGFEAYADGVSTASLPSTWPLRAKGREMLYSSGTTGKPKGIRRPLVAFENRHLPEPGIDTWRNNFQIDGEAIYLCPAPLYHAAPLRYVMRVLDMGGTVVVMPKFDAEQALQWIERYRVTHSQWVPTMFIRMLELPEHIRQQYDLSSMKSAVHAAAPCPVHIKQAMLDWWGDIIHEYYAGSETVGTTWITAPEWRRHPGSVGKPILGSVHIVSEEGVELGKHQIGKVYFSGGPKFTYWNDTQKTQSAINEKGWATYGDIGHLDEDGFLFLSDRRDDLILSGGVNVYPFEIESVISRHADVQDVAVVGVPHPVFGELPKAIVHLRDGVVADQATAQCLIDFAAGHLAKIKLPKTIVFEPTLPRLETGKLLRRILKQRYREQPDAGFAVSPSANTD